VLNYQDGDDDDDDDDDDDKLHHAVAQEALRLCCVRSVCCGVLIHKKLKSYYGVLSCGFSFKCFNVLPSASSKPILYTP
jgi:hypothetical protein